MPAKSMLEKRAPRRVRGVCFGSLADIPTSPCDVCFAPKSGLIGGPGMSVLCQQQPRLQQHPQIKEVAN